MIGWGRGGVALRRCEARSTLIEECLSSLTLPIVSAGVVLRFGSLTVCQSQHMSFVHEVLVVLPECGERRGRLTLWPSADRFDVDRDDALLESDLDSATRRE